MKIEWRTILGAAVFLSVICALYWFTSLEAAGTAMLLFGGAAYMMLFGFLLLQWFRRNKIPRPEDRYDADQADGEGEIAFFPSASIWPAGMGVGAVMLAVGLAFGTWYLLIGAILFLGAVVGFLVEAEAPEGPE